MTRSVFEEAVHGFAYDYLNEIRIYKTEIEREQALLQNLVSCLCWQHFYLTEKRKENDVIIDLCFSRPICCYMYVMENNIGIFGE